MKLLQNNVLGSLLIWESEIAKGGTWSFGIKGGPMNPNHTMIYIYIYMYIYIYIYIYTPGIVMFIGFINTKIKKQT